MVRSVGTPDGIDEYRARRLVSRMLMEGGSVRDIAERLELSQAVVRRLTRELHKRWLSESEADYRERLALELARLEDLEREARRAWRRSGRPVKIRRRVMVLKDAPPAAEPDIFADLDSPAEKVLTTVQETRETRQRDGDPRFLDLAHRCVDSRLKIMGAYKDQSIYANLITADQMMQFARAVIDGAVRAGIDGAALERLKANTIKLLPNAELPEPEPCYNEDVGPTAEEPDCGDYLNGHHIEEV